MSPLVPRCRDGHIWHSTDISEILDHSSQKALIKFVKAIVFFAVAAHRSYICRGEYAI